MLPRRHLPRWCICRIPVCPTARSYWGCRLLLQTSKDPLSRESLALLAIAWRGVGSTWERLQRGEAAPSRGRGGAAPGLPARPALTHPLRPARELCGSPSRSIPWDLRVGPQSFIPER